MVYFIIWAFIHILALGFILAKNGEPKDDKYSFFATLIVEICMVCLMYMWGAFDHLFGAL